MFFFKKKSKARYIVYLTRILKYRNLIQSFLDDDEVEKALLVYFFEESRDDIVKLLEASGLEHRVIGNQEIVRNGFNILDARKLKSIRPTTFDALIVLEVHPIYSINQIPMHLADDLKINEVRYYCGLDERVMQIFGSERLARIMETLGLEDDEAIEHSMVNKAIEKGQKTLEGKLLRHVDVLTSPDDWANQNRTD